MLSKSEVKKIAALARIGLNDKDIEKYQKDLSAILDYFEKLKELDTDNIEPASHITGRENVMRGDRKESANELEREAILSQAPETKDGFIKVKSVL
jgi:aspartyl-tRNA(Asn)/glutamyl-tRNA(Gln) amidotransferase subunit C